MKVALIGPFPPYRGGIAQFSDKLTCSFEKLNHQVMRISFQKLYPSILFPGRTQFDTGSRECPAAEKLIHPWNPFFWIRARKFIRQYSPDHIIVKWWHPFFALSLFASLPGNRDFPVSLICHNVLPHEKFPFSDLLVKALFSKADFIVVHSREDEEKARLIKYNANILRLYHPVYDQYLNSSTERSEARKMLGYTTVDTVILFFGLIRPYKGLEDLLKAFRELPENIKLLIVGECYEGDDQITELLSSPDVSDRSIWIDRFVEQEEVAGYFKASDLVVLPYRQATQSGVAQIALAFRKPLVLTRTGGLPELLEAGETGFLAEPSCPENLRDTILQCIELSKKPGISETISKFAERFSWDRYIHELERIWQQ